MCASAVHFSNTSSHHIFAGTLPSCSLLVWLGVCWATSAGSSRCWLRTENLVWCLLGVGFLLWSRQGRSLSCWEKDLVGLLKASWELGGADTLLHLLISLESGRWSRWARSCWSCRRYRALWNWSCRGVEPSCDLGSRN